MAERVLLVEDEEVQRLFYSRQLEDEGYRVSCASNGLEALRRIREEPPDIVVLDIIMPQMDGIEALSRIKSINPGLPVVLHSSYSGYRNNFLCWIADEFVPKSVNLTNLKLTIRRLLGSEPKPFDFTPPFC